MNRVIVGTLNYMDIILLIIVPYFTYITIKIFQYGNDIRELMKECSRLENRINKRPKMEHIELLRSETDTKLELLKKDLQYLKDNNKKILNILEKNYNENS